MDPSDHNAMRRGAELREQIFGAEGMKSLENADDFQMPLQDMVTRICFGEVWSRPELSLKIRSMLTIALLAGQSRPDQLKNHVKGPISTRSLPRFESACAAWRRPSPSSVCVMAPSAMR